MLFTAALVQAHWVTTDVWHELEPQSMASVLPVSPLLSVSALPLRSADLPSISQLEPSQLVCVRQINIRDGRPRDK